MIRSALLILVLSTLTGANSFGEDLKNGPLNILIMTIPARGHINPMLRLSKILLARGHNITYMVGTDEDSLPIVHNLFSSHQVIPFLFKMDGIPFVNSAALVKDALKSGMMTFLRNKLQNYTENLIQHFNHSLLAENYDLILGNEFTVGVMMCINSQWQIPVILVGSTMPFFISEQPPWPWPGLLQGHASDNLTFLQRFVSLIEGGIVKHIFNYFMMYSQYLAVHKFCPSLTTYQLYDAPGVYLPHIVPTVIGFEYPKTQTPLISYVGPNIPDDWEPLSKDAKLKDWLDEKSERSVVYISMGSMFTLNKETAKILFEGVMKTRYNLLWSVKKHNQGILDELNVDERRVFISGWTPQASVLASKAIHCAILHGGFNGLSEALFNSVPVIGLPQMIEQAFSTGRLFHNKLGLQLDTATLTSTEVEQAILTLENKEYRANLRKLKKMFQLAGGINRTVELVEFYGREGYSHLIPAYAKYHWSWIEFYNADVWLIVISLSLLLALGIYKGFKLLMRLFTRQKQKTS